MANADRRDPLNTLRPQIYELDFARRCLFWPAAIGLHAYLRSLRIVIDPQSLANVASTPAPRLILVWHNHSLVMAEVLRRFFQPRNIHCLISPSKAAAWQVALFRTFRLNVIRGSSSRRGVQAMLEMRRCLRDGDEVAISPDGPAGPCYHFQPGAFLLAQRARVPALLCHLQYHSAMRLNTWDRHWIPLPFSRVDFSTQLIPATDPLWQLPLAEGCDELQRRMRRLLTIAVSPVRPLERA